ncbi:MAG: hypothetical protein FWD72_03660 [Eggerthellaceae bacterium]|nr:hypothetical protein [Eggerthellaceae bacterium]
MQQIVTKRSTACLLAFFLVFGLLGQYLINPAIAYADNTDAEEALAESVAQVETATTAYNDATSKVDDIQKQIDENQKKIDDLEAAIPGQEEKCATALVSLYKMQQNGYSLVNMVLNAGSFDEFISSIEYISTINQTNINEVVRLRNMKADLQDTKQTLQNNKMAADAEQTRAEEALKQAQAAKEAAQQKAAEEAARKEEEARQAAEAAAQAALAQQEAEAAQNVTPPTTIDPLPTPDGVDWSQDKTTFVAQWAPRIDAYLAGSPLAGQGATFASAAYDYGVDPRFSPAISNTESSKGLYCFLPHNAWGWGQSSWSNWEDAINAHVKGLAAGYGGTISVWAAQKYCPPNWEHWYYATLAEMNKI